MDKVRVVSWCQVIQIAFDLVVRPDKHVVVVLRYTAFITREELLLTSDLFFLRLDLFLFNLSPSVLRSSQFLIFGFLGCKLAHFRLLFNETKSG